MTGQVFGPAERSLPLVSVIIPAYGRQDFLREGLRAVLADGYPALDVIVVDDGSPEDITAGLASEFAGAPIRFVRQANTGTATARNNGMAMARGVYLLLIDHDDLVIPDSIRWRVKYLQDHPEIVAVAGRSRFLRADAPLEDDPVLWTGPLTHWDLLARNRFYSPGQLLLRKAIVDRTHGFQRRYVGSDDWDLWLQMTEHGPMHVDHRFTLLYRLHDGNFSRNVIVMRRGAQDVADAAVAGLCDRHHDVGQYLAAQFISDVYAGKLSSARQHARAAGDWARVVSLAAESMHLTSVTGIARIRQKWALVRHYGRLRMSHAEIASLGRECPACRRDVPDDGHDVLVPTVLQPHRSRT